MTRKEKYTQKYSTWTKLKEIYTEFRDSQTNPSGFFYLYWTNKINECEKNINECKVALKIN